MRWLLLFLLCCHFMTLANVEIRMGLHNFPPYSVMTDNDVCGGEAIDLTREILETADIKVVAVCATAARLYKMLGTGEIDLTINIKQTKALPANIRFIEPPYTQLSLVLLSNDTPAGALNSVEKPTIAAIRGFDYSGQRQRLSAQGYQFVDLPDSIDAIEMFIKGRSNALLTYEAPFTFFMAQRFLPVATTYNRQLLDSINTYYAVSEQSLHKTYIHQALSGYAAAKQLRYFTPPPVSPMTH
ncbi:substrate-binding periplasmic protein [Arsukibacterium sp.]|uniref:substrate-binding periplasmic protein n=1 Tax=Arsukibacterium sp. TaxID=1977258 RepID=UPI00299E6B3F|nr:transporter substrate-binding domain-containing protein [Arsukibacterium sp.]MDX1677412.1 transporter substrate-binding domain-containing protein [Arsukibacterium sp.]